MTNILMGIGYFLLIEVVLVLLLAGMGGLAVGLETLLHKLLPTVRAYVRLHTPLGHLPR